MAVRLADLHNDADARWVVELLDMYCRDEFGDALTVVAAGPRESHPWLDPARRCGGSISPSTKCRPSRWAVAICTLDSVVQRGAAAQHPRYRRFAPGSRPRDRRCPVELSRSRCPIVGCCKITMEVRSDNARAQALYQRIRTTAANPNRGSGPKACKSLPTNAIPLAAITRQTAAAATPDFRGVR